MFRGSAEMTKLWFEREDIIDKVRAEGRRIYEKRGLQELPDFPDDSFKEDALDVLASIRLETKDCWPIILLEECWESISEDDPKKKKAELIQVMAVAMQWIDSIERRNKF